MIRAVYVLNPSGGLVFDKALCSMPNLNGANDKLNMAGAFHALHAMARDLHPECADGTEGEMSEETDTGLTEVCFGAVSLHCLCAATGAKFLLVADTETVSSEVAQAILRSVHAAFADHVLKDPFQQVDMPVKSPAFWRAVASIIYSRTRQQISI
ncbi:MAG: hypothetical protein MHM6MM_001463 [Cercozoa sp. M6MM]